MTETKFRFANQRVMFTYKTHVNKDDYEEWIRSIFKVDQEKMKVYIAHETGDKTDPYEHSHVIVDFGKAVQTRNCRKFDYQGIHPNISPILNKTNWYKSCNYIKKEDKSIVFADEDISTLYDRVVGCDTLIDAIKYNVTKATDVSGIMQLYDLKSYVNPEAKFDYEFKSWQRIIYRNWILREGESRTVHWVYDKIGGSGKSEFANWLDLTGQAFTSSICGGIRDFATIVSNAVKDGWNSNCIIFDLERSLEDRGSIYSVLEQIKNGVITVSKYNGRRIRLARKPVMIVFANFKPMINKLSKDRWDIWKMVKQGSEMKPCNINFRASFPDSKESIEEYCDTRAPAPSLCFGALASSSEESSVMDELTREIECKQF